MIDPGDKVIYAVPSWNNNHYTHLNGGEHVVIEATAENNFMPTAEAIRPHIAGCDAALSLFAAEPDRNDHLAEGSFGHL